MATDSTRPGGGGEAAPAASPGAAQPPTAPAPAPRLSFPARGSARRPPAASPRGGREPGLLVLNLRYFALRAVLFGAVLTVFLLLGLDGLLGFAMALVVSGLLSYPLALRQRRAVMDNVSARSGRPR